MRNAAILLAAGKSARMKDAVADKILAPLRGKPVLLYSLAAFAKSGVVNEIVLVFRNEAQRRQMEKLARAGLPRKINLRFVKGGKGRQDSVYNALLALPQNVGHVFIHDCARPLIRPGTLRKLALLVKKDKAVALAHRVTDTIKQAGKNPPRRCNLRDVERSRLWAMETPQVFALKLIAGAYQIIQKKNIRVTDDAAAAIHAGHPVTILEIPYPNPKLTSPADFAYLEFLLSHQSSK